MALAHVVGRPRRAAHLAVVAVVGVGLLTSCSSSSSKPSGGGSTAGAAPNTVQVKNFSFSPSSLSVAKGTTVTWKFDDTTAHTATSNDKTFDSGSKSAGQSFAFTFNTPGTYSYICTFHQYMKGSVTVK